MKHHLPWSLKYEVQMSLRCLTKNYVIHFLLLCLFIGRSYGDTNYACLPGLGTTGWTIPKGDIFVEVGGTLEIFCLLSSDFAHKRGVTSENLSFYNGSIPINPSFVTRLNETAVKLTIENMTVAQTMYYCKLTNNPSRYNDLYTPNTIKTYSDSTSYYSQDEMICLNRITIGNKPKDVYNFSCVSDNWEMLNVSWTAPFNGVPTNYSIYYQIPKRGGRGAVTVYDCPNDDDISTGKCTWSLRTNPSYRRTLEYLTFTIKGTNYFGNSSQRFEIHHFAHIQPKAPQELVMVNKTVSSVFLSWSIGHLHILNKGLDYKIGYTYNSTWNYKVYKNEDVIAKSDQIRINITGLEYANTPYDFRIFSRPVIATSDEFWSKPASLVVRTASCPPYSSPKTDVGSFEITQETTTSRDVLIYWNALPEIEHNGDDFHYNISIFTNNKEISVKPALVTGSYARFNDLDFNSYHFHIRSVNVEGAAKYSTSLYLPKKTEMIPEPTVFTKMDYGDGIYELSWKCSENFQSKITSFTTFWCESPKDRPYQCNGFLDWIHLPADTTKHNFTINSTSNYQFAISANSETSSSGMVWSACTAIYNKLNKMKNIGIGKIGTDFIDVRWKFECSERVNSIKGYQVIYCATVNTSNTTCIENEKMLKVFGDVTTMHANITNLEPFTYYKIKVAIFDKDDRIGPFSDEIIERTMEGAPDVRASKIEPSHETNTSVLLRWDPPASINGIFQYYKIRYNEKEVLTNVTEITLVNLTGYTSYNIRISACTVFCSEMEPKTIKTKMGIPGVVSNLSTDKINSSYVRVTWDTPLLLAGPHPIYDVKVHFDETDKNSTLIEFETADTKAEIPIPNCRSKSSRSSYTFKVRAKNVDASDYTGLTRSYIGDWSQAYSINCMPDDVPTLLQIAIFMGLCIALTCSIIFFAKRGFLKWKQMQDFNVTLPPKFINPPLFHNDSKHQDYHINIGSWPDDNAECDHLNSKSLDLDQCSVDCIDMDLDTDRETDRSSSGCYTG